MIQFESYKLLPSKLIARTFCASGILMIFLFSIFLNPEKVNFLPCIFHLLTGYSCPSCGLSHSFYAVSHLHLTDSFHYHPVGPGLYFIFLLLLLKFSFEAITGKVVQLKLNPRIIKVLFITFFCLWISFWIIKLFYEL